jgi:hypothetical protein
MELDWLCTGVLKVSHLCYMKGCYELLSWVRKKALVGIRCLTINTRANRVVIVRSVITRTFLTLCNVGQSHLNRFQLRNLWFIYVVHNARLPVISCIIIVIVQLIYSSVFFFCSTCVSFNYFVWFNVYCSLFIGKFWSWIVFQVFWSRYTQYHHHLCKSINIIHQAALFLS